MRGDRGEECSVRFNRDMVSPLIQFLTEYHQLLWLNKRLSTGDNNVFTTVLRDRGNAFSDRDVPIFRHPRCVRCITPNTSQIAITRSEENRRDTDQLPFSLNRMEEFAKFHTSIPSLSVQSGRCVDDNILLGPFSILRKLDASTIYERCEVAISTND